tara:strand:+ start:160 stop:1077 length:918 start_codon:yes stop_codon:yes gene_type:complete
MLIKKGDRSLNVRHLQQKLGLKEDGIFGSITEKAVIRYQLSNCIPVTGMVDSDMWVLLFNKPGIDNEAIEEDSDVEKQYYTTSYDQLVHRHYLPKGEYIEGPIKNDYAFLHHTAGWHNPYNTIDHWGRDSRGRVGTEFVLGGRSHRDGNDEYDGVMVQAFPDGGQAWHLGATQSGWMNRHSVGLEMCSFGYLDSDFKTYTGSKAIMEEVAVLKEEFQGHMYYHKYSDKQIIEAEKWIRYVGERDEIDIRLGLKQFIQKHGPTKGFGFQSEACFGDVKGLLTHTNVRKDKSDCYPDPNFVDMILSL